MKNLSFIVLLLLVSSAAWAQNLEKKSLEHYNSLLVRGDLEVFLAESGETSISASSDMLKNISIRQDSGKLYLDGGKGKVYLKLNKLTSLDISGAAEVYSSDTLHADKLEINMTGAGEANLLISTRETHVELSGSSDLSLSGNTSFLKAIVSGAGDLRAYRLQTVSADILLSGAGDAQVHVREKLHADVSGAGNLYHQGDPVKLEINVSGAGEVKRSNPLGSTDTTRIRLGNRKIIILEDKDEKADIGDDVFNKEHPKKKKEGTPLQSVWSGFEMGLSAWVNSNNELAMDSSMSAYSLNQGKSLVYNFNLMELHGKIIKSNLYFTTGLGIQFNNYRFENNTRLLNGNNNTTAVVDTGSIYKKSKLITTFLNAPLYLTIASNPMENGKRITFSPGIVAGWNFRSYQRRITEINGDRSKSRNFDDVNLNPFQLNASLRIGYGKFILFGNYSLTGLFQKKQGPDLMPVSAGIRIVGF
jgi:hypothetical protein